MPELPEVETICRQLAPHVVGHRIEAVEILDPRWTRPEPPQAIAGQLEGMSVNRLERFGKYLALGLSEDLHLLIHLRMTGNLLLDCVPEPVHTRARLELDDGHRLAYVDPRRFGTAQLFRGRAQRDGFLLQRLGVEPLERDFTAERLRVAARGRRAPVKAFLLDQRHVAGIGNIYADEALFRAGIHPLRAAGRVSRSEWQRLRDGTVEALNAGIEAQGASIDDFRHIDGARGSFQDRFLVHRRAGLDCPRCGHPIRKIVVAGRGTYLCERCQPGPRRRAGGRGGMTTARS